MPAETFGRARGERGAARRSRRRSRQKSARAGLGAHAGTARAPASRSAPPTPTRSSSASSRARTPAKKAAGSRSRERAADSGPPTCRESTRSALYGYRVHGPRAPREGHRFNPGKLLVDPYALAVTGEPRPLDLRPPTPTGPGLHLLRRQQRRRHAQVVVVDREFDWQGVEKPIVRWADTVIYEAHLGRPDPASSRGAAGAARQIPRPRLAGRWSSI